MNWRFEHKSQFCLDLRQNAFSFLTVHQTQSHTGHLVLCLKCVWAPLARAQWLKWGGICNNGVEGAQWGFPSQSLSSILGNWLDVQCFFFPALFITWKEVMKERHSQGDDKNRFSPQSCCDTLHPITPICRIEQRKSNPNGLITQFDSSLSLIQPTIKRPYAFLHEPVNSNNTNRNKNGYPAA